MPERGRLTPDQRAALLELCAHVSGDVVDVERTHRVVSELGPAGLIVRGLAHARRHAWDQARADLGRAIVGGRELAPVFELVAGVGLWVARDYDRSLACLSRAAARGRPRLAKQARLYAREFAASLGWAAEQRELEAQLGAAPPPLPALAAEPSQAAEQGWTLVFERGSAVAAAALDEALAGAPEHPALLAARIRVDLFDGALTAAAARLSALTPALREQLNSERAALALARRDLDEVLVRTTHARTDPRRLYLRGAALAAAGELSEAAALLERARQLAPDSVAISLALTLARYDEEPEQYGEGFELRVADLRDRAPGLLSDAAAQLDPVAPEPAEAALVPEADRLVRARERDAALLRAAQRMLTHEADVTRASYRPRGEAGPVRHVPAGSSALRLHPPDTSRALIDMAEAALFRALDISPPPAERPRRAPRQPSREPSAGRWTPRTLSPAEIEGFLADGFVALRGAFDPELARAWREDANRRLRDEPERWVRGYDPDDPDRSLRGYDPDDPATWTWERLNLEGPETVAIEEFSPRAWGAICDLLGGPERIRTRSWTNYLIINFRADAHLGLDAPRPDWSTWHIDDPSPLTRLDRIRNGLVGIALFDRLLPKSGNTWLALDSVGRVARELAAHPEGVDFVTDRGSRITTRCERFHEVTGEAGDILLMHPLMMHSASPNRSGRIRWMSNPMVYLAEPLDPRRPEPELSPVERAIRAAIS